MGIVVLIFILENSLFFNDSLEINTFYVFYRADIVYRERFTPCLFDISLNKCLFASRNICFRIITCSF